MADDVKPLSSHSYVNTVLFIKDKILPFAPATIAVGTIALFAFCLIVPNVYSPIIFKVTIITLSTYGSCLLLCFVTPYLPMPLQTASKHIQALAKELIAVIFLAAFYFVDLSKDNLQKPSKKSDPLIIFVPGYLHNSSGAAKIKSRIEQETNIPVRCINPGPLIQSVEEHSKHLAQEIQKIQTEVGSRKIKLIGHSMGGLQILDNAFKNLDVNLAITISSPCQGVKSAYTVAGDCAKDMRPHSKFVGRLNQNSQNNPNCRIVQIGLKHDLLVPLQSAFLTTTPKENTRILEGIGHADALFSDEVIDILIEEIKK